MSIQPQNNNLNYLIDPTFTNVDRLFVLPFSRTNTCNYSNNFLKYYVPDAKIKDFNVLIDGKSFFWFASKKWRRSLRKNYWHEQ